MPGELTLASGARLACDVPVMATRPNAPTIEVESGLALNACGLIAVQASLRSTSHPNVLAAPNFRLDGAAQFQAVRAAVAGLPFIVTAPWISWSRGTSNRRHSTATGAPFQTAIAIW